jgi:hypothetical protein
MIDRNISIGIIGSSYAGLCLARALHLQQFTDVKLLELRPQEAFVSEVSGSLQFHDGRHTLERLDLETLYLKTLQKKTGRTDKRELLHGLMSSLPLGWIHYMTRIYAISISKNNEHIICECAVDAIDAIDGNDGTANDGKTISYHFDIVIAADGLTSRTRHMIAAEDCVPFFLCGDAAQTYGSELCFGLYRTCYGGSEAMANAVTFVDMLSALSAPANVLDVDKLQPYTLHSWYQRRRRNAVLMASALWVILWCIFSGNSNVEDIIQDL